MGNELHFEVTRQMPRTKVETAIKAAVMDAIKGVLEQIYGEDAVKRIRTMSGNTGTNQIGFIIGDVEAEGETHPIVCTVNPIVKPFMSYSTANHHYEPFDLSEVASAYDKWAEKKKASEEEAARIKAENIKASEAARKARAAEREKKGK